MNITLESLRHCFEGAQPAQIATCASDGTPNVAYLSQVHYVDSDHVALSFQFFSKTRENVLANPFAQAQVIDPATGIQYQLALQYMRTETEGPLFEYMKARLAGVASLTGMSKVFRLRGSDVYRVLDVACTDPVAPECGSMPTNRMPALRACSERMAQCADLSSLLDELLAGLARHFGIEHAMVLVLDAANDRLYTVASRGYAKSGAGSEVALGAGVIGVAAQQQTPIRIAFLTGDYAYSLALRDSLGEGGEKEIPFPGLAEPHSQVALPIMASGRLLGVLYAESEQKLRFTYEDEDALMAITGQLGFAMQLFEQNSESGDDQPDAPEAIVSSGAEVMVKIYPADNSVFVDGEYLIKGVAGAILWKLLSGHARGRSEFSNRELRLDASLRLPDISDNLEARLILLQRRLAERCPYLRIEKTGRGRFRLAVDRPVKLDC
ncbi:GAF domain-containing protein [Rhodoferax sp.]|uniref:GAF domain-containing protein n=1 Tax=Rhodoferax sp. TaxID=50421 RepID=UPI002730D0B3|nr:GAF domain-containing protein [Rhodoferax sp.]MDP1529671.1 GAF domain-containing protein [Rhodoferax sp.]MDP1945350.1 GAF domain-containing protein [Rhodoferax sp.]MDP2441433.1 GAF domain-containing protein [Rhodoferax sp.]MDP3191810.1 GAF domain-containing protein [Rhodoferax sp.]MDP3337174.1 GAF domain-containing protein [Rhodoferax sp.]